MRDKSESLGSFSRSRISNHVGQLRRLSDVQKLRIGEEFGQRNEILTRKAQRKIAKDVIRSFRKKQTDSLW